MPGPNTFVRQYALQQWARQRAAQLGMKAPPGGARGSFAPAKLVSGPHTASNPQQTTQQLADGYSANGVAIRYHPSLESNPADTNESDLAFYRAHNGGKDPSHRPGSEQLNPEGHRPAMERNPHDTQATDEAFYREHNGGFAKPKSSDIHEQVDEDEFRAAHDGMSPDELRAKEPAPYKDPITITDPRDEI